jgi:UDP-N-acetylmuramate dehydrogenase
VTGASATSATALAQAAEALGDRAAHDVPLAPLTTYRVGGSAALFVAARTVDDLVAVGRAWVATGVDVLVIGRGSNLLVADEGFAGIVVSLAELAPPEMDTDVELHGSLVRAGAAVALPVLARRTAAASLTGFEWAVGVPGSVGGAVRMNAGGHGADMASVLHTVRVFDLRTCQHDEVPVASLQLGFRRSRLTDHEIVLAAALSLRPGERERSEEMMADIVRWRREHQPGGQNAGSVFVNPDPGRLSAGALIDGLGLRGLRIGTAEVSTKHANFIQADPGGRADDVRAVMEAVRARVLAERGIHLRSEIRLVGFPASGHDES